MTEERETLTVAQAARLLQVSQETIRRHLKAGLIPGWKVGRQWRISSHFIEVGRPRRKIEVRLKNAYFTKMATDEYGHEPMPAPRLSESKFHDV